MTSCLIDVRVIGERETTVTSPKRARREKECIPPNARGAAAMPGRETNAQVMSMSIGVYRLQVDLIGFVFIG
jgi:hypothetical protein